MEQRTRRKRKKNYFFIVLIAVCLLVYIVMQWYLINRNKIETVKAEEGYINDSILSTGIVCRDEIILSEATDGYYYYNIENGDRVSSGMLIAEIYPTENDINTIYQFNHINDSILKLEEAQNFMSSVNVDISITRRQLSSSMVDFSGSLSAGNFENAYDSMSDISLYLNKINVAMNREGDLEGTVTELKNYSNTLMSRVSQPLKSLYSPQSGYFLNSVDGYEETALLDKFRQTSYAEGLNIIYNPQNNPSEAAYGKIITDYEWKFCTYVTQQQAEKLYEGQRLRLSINVEQQEYQYVNVESIVPKEDNMCLVILKASTINRDSVSARVRDCEILFSQYKGIKIPKSAIRIIDGQMGVYVKFSKLVQFKKIDPVYQDENYVILPVNGDENNEVELYDNVIVKGVNLYDGKYL